MPTFVSLVNWTDQGIKNYRDSVRRAGDYRGLVEKHGGQVRQLVWTLGEYDVVAVTDFPDDETATAVALQTRASSTRPRQGLGFLQQAGTRQLGLVVPGFQLRRCGGRCGAAAPLGHP